MRKTGTARNKKAHMLYMEQKAIINAMSSAMWSAELGYLAYYGMATPAMREALYRFICLAQKIKNEKV